MAVNDTVLILDTCILRDESFMDWLKRNHPGLLTVSSVAYMEYRRQLIRKHGNASKLEHMLHDMDIKVVPFDKLSAELAADLMSDRPEVCPTCNKLDWTDTMIYSTDGWKSTILVTYNVSDYPTYEDRVYTPEMVVGMLSGDGGSKG